MPDDVMTVLQAKAERSDPPVRAAALMRIARVRTAFDGADARRTFERGLEEARLLTGSDRDPLLHQARRLAAAVAPDLLAGIPPDPRFPLHFESEWLGKVMLEHEQTDAAYEYVIAYGDTSSFPLGLASSLIHRLSGDRRATVLRRAADAWRTAPPGDRHPRHPGFVWVFQANWNELPPDEARDLAREIVRQTLDQPDTPASITYGQDDRVVFTSTREHTLFLIINALQHLDAPLAASLLDSHEQLAAAARRFPDGMQTIAEEAERRRTASPPASGRRYGMAGSPDDFPYMATLMRASDDGDFEPAIEHALAQYRDDTDPARPNRAPKEFWPSAGRFRAILYQAGKRLGRSAAAWLDRIPDPDLRLLAEIELEAALAGLPEFRGEQREYRPSGRADRRIF